MLYDALFGPSSGRERDVAAGGDIFTDDSFGMAKPCKVCLVTFNTCVHWQERSLLRLVLVLLDVNRRPRIEVEECLALCILN